MPDENPTPEVVHLRRFLWIDAFVVGGIASLAVYWTEPASAFSAFGFGFAAASTWTFAIALWGLYLNRRGSP